MKRNTLFGENKVVKKDEKKYVILNFDRSFKLKLSSEFRKRLNYIPNRLDEVLTKQEVKEIKQNINDMYNFHLTKIAKLKQVDYLVDSSITIEVQEVNKQFRIKHYTNISDVYCDSLEELTEFVRKSLIKDYSTTAKYCLLGYIADKRKFRIDEYE